MRDHKVRAHGKEGHGVLLKPLEELVEGVCSEQQGYMGPPSKASLGPVWASVPTTSSWMGSLWTDTHSYYHSFSIAQCSQALGLPHPE